MFEARRLKRQSPKIHAQAVDGRPPSDRGCPPKRSAILACMALASADGEIDLARAREGRDAFLYTFGDRRAGGGKVRGPTREPRQHARNRNS